MKKNSNEEIKIFKLVHNNKLFFKEIIKNWDGKKKEKEIAEKVKVIFNKK